MVVSASHLLRREHVGASGQTLLLLGYFAGKLVPLQPETSKTLPECRVAGIHASLLPNSPRSRALAASVSLWAWKLVRRSRPLRRRSYIGLCSAEPVLSA